MTLFDIGLRLSLTVFFSSMMGLEREKNQSSAGLKTHTLVGIGSCIIALIQAQIAIDSHQLALLYPGFATGISSDSSRLIAQVVSGIGFLGAGTIIITKRSISGLTTSASIWAVAALGIALGMGFFEIASLGFITIILILFTFKRYIKISIPQRLIIKYLDGPKTQELIFEVFESMNLSVEILRYDVEVFHDTRIFVSVFEVDAHTSDVHSLLVARLSKDERIVSIQTTKI